MSKVTKCRECGGDKLYWSQCNSNKTGIAEGRLRTHEVTCSFVLGCEDCSETMAVIGADKFISNYDATQSELTALKAELASEEQDHAELRDVVAALREELAQTKDVLATANRTLGEFADDSQIYQQRLTAAEQRNADMLNWLRRQANAEKGSTERSVFIEAYNALKKIAEAQHTESGASE